ncbi:MAG: hypothetical protein FWD28_07970 [Treponema sp.]|nr:hypothetical protein [Treponema sp.]
MVKLYTSITDKIDEPNAAVRDILEQLNPKENMLKNTIGIVHFHFSCKEKGTCEEIIKELPFEVCGCVTTFMGSKETYAESALSVTMITSDDVYFDIKTVEGINSKTREQLTEEVETLLNNFTLNEKPKVVFPFIPMVQNFTSDDLVDISNNMEKDKWFALFGTVAFNQEKQDDSGRKEDSTYYVLADKKITADIFAFVAFYGDIKPKFSCTSAFAYENRFMPSVTITENDGLLLKKVNDMNILEYFFKRGITNKDNQMTSSKIWAVPAILKLGNGIKLVRAFLNAGEGADYVFSTGSLETGANITFSMLDGEKTIESAKGLINNLYEKDRKDVIAYSCAARAWSLDDKISQEAHLFGSMAKKYREENDKEYNYVLSYSGGEICPAKDDSGKFLNVFQNYSLISVTFN